MNLPAIDIVFFVLLGLLALRGFLKGLTGEFFSVASAALGLAGAFFFFRSGAAFLKERYTAVFLPEALPLAEILAFLGIFLVVFIAGKVCQHIVRDIITRLGLTVLDKCLGLFFGLAEAAVLIAAVLFLLTMQPLFDAAPLLEHSLFARFFLPFMGNPALLPEVPGGAVV